MIPIHHGQEMTHIQNHYRMTHLNWVRNEFRNWWLRIRNCGMTWRNWRCTPVPLDEIVYLTDPWKLLLWPSYLQYSIVCHKLEFVKCPIQWEINGWMVLWLYTLEVMCLIATMKLYMKSYYDYAYYQIHYDLICNVVLSVFITCTSRSNIWRWLYMK